MALPFISLSASTPRSASALQMGAGGRAGSTRLQAACLALLHLLLSCCDLLARAWEQLWRQGGGGGRVHARGEEEAPPAPRTPATLAVVVAEADAGAIRAERVEELLAWWVYVCVCVCCQLLHGVRGLELAHICTHIRACTFACAHAHCVCVPRPPTQPASPMHAGACAPRCSRCTCTTQQVRGLHVRTLCTPLPTARTLSWMLAGCSRREASPCAAPTVCAQATSKPCRGR